MTVVQSEMDTSSGKIPLRTHWIPRFVSAGVEHQDLQDLLRSIHRWDVWCKEWSAKAAMHEQIGEEALRQGDPGRAPHRTLSEVRSSLILLTSSLQFTRE